MEQLRKLVHFVAAIPMMTASVALFALMVLTFADVVMRSAFNMPIEAATELIRIAIAIIVFSALPILSGSDQHIVVDLADPIVDRLGLSRLRDGVITLACGLMLWLPAQRVVDLAERARSYGDQTEYLNIPTFYVAWFVAAMTFVTAAVLVVRGLLVLLAPKTLGFFKHD
ncbi:TRAP transporter small permease subunit [Oricola sp.]|uniref:TRAP transporter small permease n=1 Tax=Oricola sp. TaxID=1979950 RepID=UPI0025CE8558|nr:TRAP transporter small permease subunit [Oricola sp.]MCI5076040.1 TRAP transporter small permease [Oricola sp.]